ncbi:Mitochondrial substrate carrier family protein [Perilla frutescens var. hirtella]|uniref:Mitochondrial substrate carrier family protein n=1 Tax=Perilla frutescens var. hirtella TaxID=608512 RepID=A0AAD4P2Q2_PERFH|nr:Mitochondrial substrate carrier family protein [Perilla frutescens var. hirtella]
MIKNSFFLRTKDILSNAASNLRHKAKEKSDGFVSLYKDMEACAEYADIQVMWEMIHSSSPHDVKRSRSSRKFKCWKFCFQQQFLHTPISAKMGASATATAVEATQNLDQASEFYTNEVSAPPPIHDGLEFWQFMIAGSIAGSVEHMAMFPVDTLKTRMQAITSSTKASSITLRQSLGSIMKFEGLGGLYRGIAAMGLGAGPAHAVYFSIYESCKKYLSAGNPNSPVAHAASGVCATVASDAVLTPMDVVKQRLQLKGSPYKGVCDCVRRVLVEEGFGAFYASYRTTVVMNAPFTAVHFATYEAAKRGLMKVSPGNGGEDEENLLVHATAGAAAGALAAAVTTPLDVVKTQLQCQGVCGCDRLSSSSISGVVGIIKKKDGYGGLMRGWIPRMLFHAPAAAICWSTYESVKKLFL